MTIECTSESCLMFSRTSPTLTDSMSKDALLVELAHVAHLMIPGSLSEVTRQCGDPSCACARDPSRRHGPHLYLRFSASGKAHSVYVPPEDRDAVVQAHEAWLRFNELASRMAECNRRRLLHELGSHKEVTRAQRAKSRARA
jgi:hypothetical protein